jgi:TolA-binding protein
MLFENNKNKRVFRLFILNVVILTIGFCLPVTATRAASDIDSKTNTAVDKHEYDQKIIAGLLKKAKNGLEKGALDEAATAFYEIYLNFPDAKEAENALWQTAKLRKKITYTKRDADFEQVRDLFRRYINYYPKSVKIPEAYLELGISYYHMRFYREALSYFKLFVKNYRASPLILQAQKWQGDTLIKIGHNDEAEGLFKGMSADKDLNTRIIGKIGMGDLRYGQGKYRRSKDFYQIVMSEHPEYYIKDPEILRKAGLADIKFGKVARGRQELYHYLSLEQGTNERIEVLASLADSYYRTGNQQMANTLFQQIIENGEAGDKMVLLANLRLAQYKDSSKFQKSKWDKPQDLTDPKGDKPYLAVLDRYYNGFMVQEARYGLFLRYKARHDLNNAYDIGRSFLRNSADYKAGTLESKRVGDILLYLVQEFLQAKKYQKIYDLYFVDYRHVKDFPDGRLLYVVGQAMEKLGLYDQAAVVYYRALKWPLPEADKADLYLRRAHVYLLKKDYVAAKRLLTYLRKIYKDSDNIGSVFFYSGQLAAAQNDKNGALDYYQQAAASSKVSGKVTEYTGYAVDMALELGFEGRAYEIWRRARQGGNLAPVVAQELALKIGNAFRENALWDKAVEIYKAALAEDLPSKGRDAQYCNLYLGDSLMALGNKPDGVIYYQKAKAGEDQIIKKLAVERLRQNEISSQLTEMNQVIGK